MQPPVYTSSMEARAAVLVGQAQTWARGVRHRDGLAFVVFASSKPGTVYYTTESGCTCPSYWHRGACSHVLAVQVEARQARAAVGPRALDRMNELFDRQLVDAF